MTIHMRIAIFFTLTYAVVVIAFAIALHEVNESNAWSRYRFALKAASGAAAKNIETDNLGDSAAVAEDIGEAIGPYQNQLGVLRGVILDTRDSVVASLNGLPRNAPFGPDGGNDGFRRLTIDGKRYLGFASVFEADERPRGTVVLFASTSSVEDSVDGLKNVLMLLIPASIALVAAGSAFVSKRALKPLDDITREIDAIDAASSFRRLRAGGSDDEIGRLIRAFNSLTDRVHRLLESQRAFLSDASHELKTPLTVVQTEIEMLGMNPNLNAADRENLRDLQAEVERATTLATDLIVLARLESAEAGSPNGAFDVDAVLTETAARMAPLAKSRGVRMDVRPECGAAVEGRPDSLGRAIANLVENAVKYADPRKDDRFVRLTASESGGSVRITIEDNGRGIREEEVPRVFERFFRTREARGGNVHGSGLGLAIVRAAVERMHGCVTLNSTFGSGSTVSIQLPAAPKRCDP